MKHNNHHCGWVIVLSFIIALILTIVPLSESFAPARPEFAALFLIYWNMALPHRVGVGVGWTLGLFVDVITEPSLSAIRPKLLRMCAGIIKKSSGNRTV